MTPFSSRVKTIMGNLSVRKFAKEVDLSPATISRICNDGIPDVRSYIKLLIHERYLGHAPALEICAINTFFDKEQSNADHK